MCLCLFVHTIYYLAMGAKLAVPTPGCSVSHVEGSPKPLTAPRGKCPLHCISSICIVKVSYAAGLV